jgi:hypothetical protein
MNVYKFVELPVVTEDTLEETVNAWVGKGWALEAIRFVVTEHSRRPAMAFVSFVRDGAPEMAEKPAPAVAKPAPVAIGQDDEPLRPRRRTTSQHPPIELGEAELAEDGPVIDLARPDPATPRRH